MEGYTYHNVGEQDFTRIVVVEPGEPADKLQRSLSTINKRTAHSPSSRDDSILDAKRPAAVGNFHHQRQSSFLEPTFQEPKTSTSEDMVYNALSYV